MAELTVPQIDFSSLGQLPQLWKQGQADALRQQTLANLGNGTATPQDLVSAGLKIGDLNLARLGQSQLDAQYQHGRDTVADQHWDQSFKLQQANAARAQSNADREWNYDPTEERAAQAKAAGIDTNTPEGRQFVLTGSLPEAPTGKPIPFETIGGTKFLMKNDKGGYSVVDPSSIGGAAPQAATPTTGSPANPGAPGGPEATSPAPQSTPKQVPDINAIDEKTGRREGYLQSLDPQVQDYIKKVANYEIDPRTTSVKGGMREKLMSAVAKYDPTYDQNEFGARAKAIKDFSTGTQGNIVRSFDVAIDHLDTLQKAATAMQNGDVTLLNKIRNAWREQTGSDLPTNFQALVPLVSGEIAKAVIGSNNALSDREELRTNLQNAKSPDQIAGVITGYKGLMSGQLKGLRKQYEATTGKKDFDSKLRQHTLDELSGASKASPVTIDGYTIKEN